MKLRLKENSIRLRLLRSEVAALAEKGTVYETVQFGERVFTYSITSEDAGGISAHFLADHMLVKIPQALARDWADSETVSLEASQPVGENAEVLKILIEKDFVCIGRPDDPDNADAFSSLSVPPAVAGG
jgi:hypothetical protein